MQQGKAVAWCGGFLFEDPRHFILSGSVTRPPSWQAACHARLGSPPIPAPLRWVPPLCATPSQTDVSLARSANKIRAMPRCFGFGEGKPRLFAKGNAPQQPRHVVPKVAHHIKALFIRFGLLGVGTVYHRPIA